ncbi:MAG: hypothetical protein QOC83_1741, partial [Pseudonocardiales bacterium]|nr:hypothetical protein [Pseudonocardiales bacterium]
MDKERANPQADVLGVALSMGEL